MDQNKTFEEDEVPTIVMSAEERMSESKNGDINSNSNKMRIEDIKDVQDDDNPMEVDSISQTQQLSTLNINSSNSSNGSISTLGFCYKNL